MSSPNQFLLHEDASGYALFRHQQSEIIQDQQQLAAQIDNYATFKSMVSLVAFTRFESAEEALNQMKSIAIGECSKELENFLDLNLAKTQKKQGKTPYTLGVWDAELGKNLNAKFPCNTGSNIKELLRGCLIHFHHYVKDQFQKSSDSDQNVSVLTKAQCGLAHCYSRDKMQLDPNRQDKPILNTISILDGLDKNINTFAMRMREWYAWHFPELAKIVTDNISYAKVCRVVRIKEVFDCEDEENKRRLEEACGGSSEMAEEVISAVKVSMGQDIVEFDMANIDRFASHVIELATMRQLLQEYLKRKMDIVAPNLTSLIGEFVGARLISHAGSLINLAKYPASTVQILGAEKALFRALKTKGNTPKYGLLYHSSYIGRAQQKNKGRMSRYLANKCSIASRIDCFYDSGNAQESNNAMIALPTTKIFGESMKQQCEDRLAFLTEGVKPKKNVDVMAEAIKMVEKERMENMSNMGSSVSVSKKRSAEEANNSNVAEEPTKKKKKKDKKEATVESSETIVPESVKTTATTEEEGAKKKKKKDKKEAQTVETEVETVKAEAVVAAGEKKKKKKEKN